MLPTDTIPLVMVRPSCIGLCRLAVAENCDCDRRTMCGAKQLSEIIGSLTLLNGTNVIGHSTFSSVATIQKTKNMRRRSITDRSQNSAVSRDEMSE